MNKRSIFLGLAACLIFTAMPAVSRSETLLEKILTVVIADRFGIDTREVVEIRRDSKYSMDDLGGLLSGSYFMNRQAREVWRLRASGLGWGQVAKKIGMHPGQFNKLRNAGAFDGGKSWSGAISQRFGVKETDIAILRRSGAKLEDVVAAVILSKASGDSPQKVYDRYKSIRDWDRVSERYKVDLESDWKDYAKPPARPKRDEAAEAAPASGPGNSQGKGKGKGKGGKP